jgi:alkylation response protein AidB-like acyl-CoA dehydrogenase
MTVELFFDNVVVPASTLVGAEGSGFPECRKFCLLIDYGGKCNMPGAEYADHALNCAV